MGSRVEPFLIVCAIMFGVGVIIGWIACRQRPNWPKLLLAALLGSAANGFVLTIVMLMATFILADPNSRPGAIFYPPVFALFLLFTFGAAAACTTPGCLIGCATRLIRSRTDTYPGSGQAVESAPESTHCSP
jgi:hypothetical protein